MHAYIYDTSVPAPADGLHGGSGDSNAAPAGASTEWIPREGIRNAAARALWRPTLDTVEMHNHNQRRKRA